MKKKIVALALSILMVAGTITGCGQNSGNEKTEDKENSTVSKEEESTETKEMKVPDEITFYVYYADSAVPQIDEILKRMKVIYPDLTINIEHRTDADGTVLKTRAAVGELPDIFECTGQLTDILRESGDLAELDDTIEEKGLFSKFQANNFDVKKSDDGHYYALDYVVPEACLIYYNKEVFDKLGLKEPQNYDEFKNVVETLDKNGIIPLALFAQEKWPGLQMYDMAVVGQGQPLGLTGLEDGTTKITDPEYLEAAQKIEELVSMGLIGKGALNTNASQAFELLGTGQAGMLINGVWYFDDAETNGYADKIDYFNMNPFVDAGKEEEVKGHYSGGTGSMGGYAVSAKGEYADFCEQVLMDWIEQKAIVSAEMGKLCVLEEPVKSKTERSESYLDYANNLNNIQTTTKYEFALNNQELIVALEDASELLNTGSYKAEDFISDLDLQISEIDLE